MALKEMLGMSDDSSDEGMPMPKKDSYDHEKGFASRLKSALDSGNDRRVKMLLRECIDDALEERGEYETEE
jgi:hypothetical protein